MNGSGMGRHTVISEQPCVGALEADGLAVEVVVVDDHSDQLGVFVRVAKPLREGDAAGRWERNSSLTVASMGVSMIPGAMVQTRIPYCARSRAAGRVRAAIPPLEEE